MLFNGTGKGPLADGKRAFSLQEQPIMIASSGLAGPVTIQYLQLELGVWTDVMVGGQPLLLTADNTFTFLTIQGAYRLKPDEATGEALIWASEVTNVPEWDNGKYSGSAAGGGGSGGGGVYLPQTWTNLDGSIVGKVGE
jgi:hypothetical protein